MCNVTCAGVCSGVGGFDLAFERAGAQILWLCEMDKACNSVLERRFPGKKRYGDMLSEELFNAQRPRIFFSGTPCQGFSVAGLRKGLNDDRSNLALRFLQLCDHFQPELILWENVPGVLSDKENAFGCFLAGLVGANAPLVPGRRWSRAGVVAGPKRTAAWRVLDSQYFSVAQRRERVFVVASARAELPFQILFEPEGVRRHSPPSREAGQRVAPTVETRSRNRGYGDFESSGGLAAIPFGGNKTSGPLDVATACNAHGGPCRHDFESETFIATGQGYWNESKVAESLGTQARAVYESTAVAHALRAEGFDASEDGTGRGTPLVPIAFNARQDPDAWVDRSGPVDTNGCTQAIAFKPGQGGKSRSLSVSEDLSPTLEAAEAGNNKPAVAFQEAQTGCREYETAGSLRANGPGHDPVGTRIREGYAVRRLTPLECERLQGFPDDWTLVTNPKGKPMADGPRYKMMGNAVTVNVIEWLARRILKALNV